MLSAKYVCDGQMSIFDFLEPERKDSPTGMIDDDDVREIADMVMNLCIANRMEICWKPEYETWEHVPRFGKRFSVCYKYTDNTRPFGDFDDKLEKIVEYAKSKKVKLYIADLPGRIYFDTTFMDKRRRIK